MRIFLRVPLLLRTLFFKLTACIISSLAGLIQATIITGYTYTQTGILIFPRYIINKDKIFFPGWYPSRHAHVMYHKRAEKKSWIQILNNTQNILQTKTNTA